MATEKRLIDATSLEQHIAELFGYPSVDILHEIATFPTVDAVEVVRCKDCKYWMHIEDGMGDCTNGRFHLEGHPDPTMMMNEFCCLGERREGE